jgi:transcriptional regulator with XRE-family HTH domain
MINFKALLKEKRIKQVEIAMECGVQPSSMSQFLNGVKPIPSRYHKKIGRMIGISVTSIQKHNDEILERRNKD